MCTEISFTRGKDSFVELLMKQKIGAQWVEEGGKSQLDLGESNN